MAVEIVSTVLKKQTELAWQYLEKARPLITYEKLVPVAQSQIDLYEKVWEKIVPPDYRYWLTTWGSGLIEFLEGDLPIVSLYELKECDGRLTSADDPQNCHKRIYIGYAGAPVTSCLDSTIIDEDGCAPVIQTSEYGNNVEKVLASSWPMFVIKSIIDIAVSLKKQTQAGTYTDEQIAAIHTLADLDFALLDEALEKASAQAIAHNNTQNGDGDDVVNAEMTLSMLGFLEECKSKQNSNGGISRLLTLITGLFTSDDEFSNKVKELEDRIDKGYSSLVDFSYFFSHEVEKRHAEGVKVLLGHERREVRKLAEQGWLRLNPGEAEKQATRMWDWLKCAENWLAVDKSGNEAVRCLREAEKAEIDISSTAWRACADFWLDQLQNKSEARRCLLIAEKQIDPCDPLLSQEYIFQAMFWVKLKEFELAGKDLLLAEEAAGPGDYIQMIWASQYWRKDLQDSEAAKRCLRKAEPLVPDHHPVALGDILREWELIGDKDEIEDFKTRSETWMK